MTYTFPMLFHLVSCLPRLVARFFMCVENEQFDLLFFGYFIFINNQGKQHRKLKK